MTGILHTYIPNRVIDSNGISDGASLAFYLTGTTTPAAIYSDSSMATPLANPVVVNAGAAVPDIYLDPSITYRRVVSYTDGGDPQDTDPYMGLGSGGVSFIQDGDGAVLRDLQSRGRETLSVLDFIPAALHAAILDGTSTDDVTSYIDAVCTIANALDEEGEGTYLEREVVFPGGKYCVTKWDQTGLSRIVFRALGTVQIVGIDDSEPFIMGSSVYSDGDPDTGLPWVGDPPFNRELRFTGGEWLVAPEPGQLYACGWLIEGFVYCVFERILASGEYGNPAAGDRTTGKIEMSFLNTFNQCIWGNPRAATSGSTAYSLYAGANNINGNVFEDCRFVGPGAAADSVACSVSSATNSFRNCDLSVHGTAFLLSNAGSTHIVNCYSELVSCVVKATVGNSKGTVIAGGVFEIYDGGTAFLLSSTENTFIYGARFRAGTGCTFLAMGGGCYGRSILNIQIEAGYEFDTWESGTERGNGDLLSRDVERIRSSGVMFPATAVPSSDPNTLDDYSEETITPGIKVGTTAQTVTGTARVTKIGRLVVVHGSVVMAAAVSGTGNIKVTLGSMTYLPAALSSVAIAFGATSFTGDVNATIGTSSTDISVWQTSEAGTRSALTHANLTASSEFQFNVAFSATA